MEGKSDISCFENFEFRVLVYTLFAGARSPPFPLSQAVRRVLHSCSLSILSDSTVGRPFEESSTAAVRSLSHRHQHLPQVGMEELYSKLYNKYQRLKSRKFSNLKHFNEEQNTKFLNYVSAAEEMIGHLKYENETLQTKINELKAQADAKGSELVDLANKVSEYQNLLLEQNEKRNELAKEVDKLNSLLKLRDCESNYNGNVIHSMSPFSGLDISQRLKDSSTKEPSQILPESASFKDDGKSFDKVDKCGLTKGSVAADPHDMYCLFQTLLECLVRMSFSSVKENDGLQLSVCHQLSGYSFSLSWIKKEGEVTADDEVLYQVSSLGTIERIAPDWMREDLIFSTRMCPLFFERISQVIRLHN